MKKESFLYLGNGRKEFFHLPSGWSPVYEPEAVTERPGPTVDEMARQALDAPKGTSPINDIAGRAGTIVILVDDGTRPTPVRQILPVLLERLESARFPREKVTIVVALGSHAPLDSRALEERLGPETLSRYAVIQHDAWQADLVPVDVPDLEGVVKINPAVIDADTRIAISSVAPHSKAGYGGGPENPMPGVANADFFTRHHMIYTVDERAQMGATLGNPFFETCMTVARTVGLDLSINCVYNKQGSVCGIVAGSLDAAFTEAVRQCAVFLGVRCSDFADVTVTSSFPHTHGVQFCKGLRPPGTITRPTGAVLLAAPLTASLPEEFVESVMRVRETFGADALAAMRRIMSKGELVAPERSPEYNMALYDLISRTPARTVLVSTAIPESTATKLGFEYAPSVEAGIAMLETSYPKAKVAVFPAGGLLIPSV
jgi:lactate racemase